MRLSLTLQPLLSGGYRRAFGPIGTVQKNSFEGTCAIGEYEIREEFWHTEGAPKSERDGARYLRHFVKMARSGLYSYDTVLRTPGYYFGVTLPRRPLKLTMLPDRLREQLAKTRSPLRFSRTPAVPEEVTLAW